MLKISIPQPCHEDWQNMQPTQCGAYCNVCAKEVIDFSVMTDDEVKNFFLKNRHATTCGKFRRDQLKRLEVFIPSAIFFKTN
jgi:hypothetical protein